jgi:hypothetical protein
VCLLSALGSRTPPPNPTTAETTGIVATIVRRTEPKPCGILPFWKPLLLLPLPILSPPLLIPFNPIPPLLPIPTIAHCVTSLATVLSTAELIQLPKTEEPVYRSKNAALFASAKPILPRIVTGRNHATIVANMDITF